MFHRLARILVLIAAVQILGGHWAVLQTLAWSGMFIENVRTAPLGEAVVKTFNGSKPCNLCVAVREGRKNEEQKTAPKLLVKLEAVLVTSAPLPLPPASFAHDFPSASVAAPRAFSPPTPPPRFA